MDEKRVINENVSLDFEERNPQIIKENLEKERENSNNEDK